jgi:hypothetical protein
MKRMGNGEVAKNNRDPSYNSNGERCPKKY